MSTCRERRCSQLGMDAATATARLKKQLMFHMAQQLNMTTCFRCGKEIERWEELSLDHKEPWLYVDVQLFWNMDNLAFSHWECNTKHQRPARKEFVKGGSLLRKGDNENVWCNKCKQVKPRDEFSANKSNWNGLQNRCNDCRKQRSKTHRKTGGHSVKEA